MLHLEEARVGVQLLLTVLQKQCYKNRPLPLDFLANALLKYLSENSYEYVLLEEQNSRYRVDKEFSNATFKIKSILPNEHQFYFRFVLFFT